MEVGLPSSLRAYPSGLPPATSLGIYLYYGIIDRWWHEFIQVKVLNIIYCFYGGWKYAPIELILFNIILLCILYIQIYELFSDHVAKFKETVWLPSSRAGFHPPGHPPSSLRLPFFFGFLLVLSSRFHIFGTKL